MLTVDPAALVSYGAGAPPYGKGKLYFVGSEVFTVGLFGGYYGERFSRPTARFGHIALIPTVGEKILAELGTPDGDLTPIEAMLVEVAAWKGQSGSPVFVRTGKERVLDSLKRLEKQPYWVVGMIQGFYPAAQDAFVEGKPVEILQNMGLAIVLPARLIVEMLMEDERLVESRRRAAKDNGR